MRSQPLALAVIARERVERHSPRPARAFVRIDLDLVISRRTGSAVDERCSELAHSARVGRGLPPDFWIVEGSGPPLGCWAPAGRPGRDEAAAIAKLISERLEGNDLKPSAVKDLTMRSGAIGLRQLADVPPDTPAKLAMHFFPFENLEIATYELLSRIAKEAGDQGTADVAERILEQEWEAAGRVESSFDRSAELTLQSEISVSE